MKTYIQLEPTYKKNGYDYALVDRKGDVCIFSQESEGRVIAYEVFEVNKNEDREVFGKAFAASESVPPTTQWGSNAFTVWNLERAYQMQEILLNKIAQRPTA